MATRPNRATKTYFAKPSKPDKVVKTGMKKARGGIERGSPISPTRRAFIKYQVKEAILEAADLVGRDGKGKDGAVGYFAWLARAEPAVFGSLMAKIMPTQVEVNDTTRKTMSPSQVVDSLRNRGIPVPPLLLDLAAERTAEREPDEKPLDDDFSGLGAVQPIIEVEDDDEDSE